MRNIILWVGFRTVAKRETVLGDNLVNYEDIIMMKN